MRCNKCSKKKSILLECKYCNISFCSSCIELDIHSCENKNECRKRKLKELENDLLSAKQEKNKIIKI